jgi:hypothetical protein
MAGRLGRSSLGFLLQVANTDVWMILYIRIITLPPRSSQRSDFDSHGMMIKERSEIETNDDHHRSHNVQASEPPRRAGGERGGASHFLSLSPSRSLTHTRAVSHRHRRRRKSHQLVGRVCLRARCRRPCPDLLPHPPSSPRPVDRRRTIIQH